MCVCVSSLISLILKPVLFVLDILICLILLFASPPYIRNGGSHFKTHPVRHRQDRKWILPLCLHGDGTPCSGVGKSWSRQMDFWTWSSLVAWSGFAELVRYLIFCVQASLRRKETLETVFKKMAWSFNALEIGTWPEFDWDNKRIDYRGRMGQAMGLSRAHSLKETSYSVCISCNMSNPFREYRKSCVGIVLCLLDLSCVWNCLLF